MPTKADSVYRSAYVPSTTGTVILKQVVFRIQQYAIDIAFVQEANVTAMDNEQDPCFVYKETIAPSTSTIGSGLACVAASGVTILWQLILWQQLLQLQTIVAETIREDAWVLGDLNISEESTSDISSGSVEALTELLDQVSIVNAAYIFEATHLPTRVATFGSRIDTSLLDRILQPSGIPKQGSASMDADYPSLPDLIRALRLHR
ncbi:hypothetical protein LAZ67_11002002 [Cordylochernes scorpioides]|uniref:Endonuclease/exonuclease/phosphatase domain-containing protein n=1 Tax=Cordylochernes scorpioides TaxID=51811 RepID=A0ABY6KZD3_9ARAC|nr:hypothetical protein LAZ67_11002002 [Cordylochernes scorpioides]